MMNAFKIRSIAGLVLLCLSGSPVFAVDLPPLLFELPAATSGEPEEKTARLIVYYKDDSQSGIEPKNHRGSNDRGSHPPEDVPVQTGVVRSEFGDGTPLILPVPLSIPQATAYAAELERDPRVHAVLVDRRIGRHGGVATNDSLNYLHWNLAAGDAGSSVTEPVWPQGQGYGVSVAVLDTGRVIHPDMLGAWAGGYDMVSDAGLAGDGDGRDADPTDTMTCDDGNGPTAGTPHGLMVGSIIAARMNNSEGIAGVAPQASIMPVRVISSCGGWLSDVLDGMRWAVGLPVAGLPTNLFPAKVLNLSLGTTSPGVACSPSIQAIINEVRATGAAIVVSTGNDGANAISVPAACNGVIAVTATSKFGNRAFYANAGAGTTIAAPGGGCAANADPSCNQSAYNYVPVASHDGTNTAYAMSIGTSFSAPHVAAAAALLLERNPARTPDAIASALVNSARPLAAGACTGSNCGAGILDVNAALLSQGFTLSAQISASAIRGGEVVTLTGEASAGANSPLYTWRQTAGSLVTLVASVDGKSATFTAPQANDSLSFELSAVETSGMTRIANVSATLTVAPELAPVGLIQAEPNTQLRQNMLLADGSQPAAISVDANAEAQGVKVENSQIVWTVPTSGSYTVKVTPYDEVGAGLTTDLSIQVKGDVGGAGVNPMSGSGGGGALGLHGAVLLALALSIGWLLQRRGRTGAGGAFRYSSLLHSLPAACAIVSVALFAVGYPVGESNPATGWITGQVLPALWSASFIHIDVTHLLVNLIGLVMLQHLFARYRTSHAWLFAVLIGAPLAHGVVLTLGMYDWVAGMSTVLHAVFAWMAVQLLMDARNSGRSQDKNFATVLMVGLFVKIALDTVWVTEWAVQGAHSAPALHLIGALAGVAGAAIFYRPGRQVSLATLSPMA